MAFYILPNEAKRFVAVFNPKCGCTTLKAWFIQSLELDRPPDDDRVGRFRVPTVPEGDYLRILFLRDPYRRLVSFYCHAVLGDGVFNDADERRLVPLRDRSFSEFIHVLHDLFRVHEPLQHHLKLQVTGIEDVAFDHVIRTEDLDRELPALSQRLGIDFPAHRLNATRYDEGFREPVGDWAPERLREAGAPAYPWFYDDTLVDLASEIYEEDLVYFRRAVGECATETLRSLLATRTPQPAERREGPSR